MNYRLGLVSVSFRKNAPREILEAMKEVGLGCIEWGSDIHCPPERAAEIAALQKEFDITCSSYGTYFRIGVTPLQELDDYIRAAKILGTSTLRLWCGNKNAEEYCEQERRALFLQCKKAASIAEKNGVTLCMECHNNTYTNTKESAWDLMQNVCSEKFRMYWQPNQYRSEQENIEYAKLLSPYTVSLHVFNWKGKEKHPLCEAKELWQKYLSCFDDDKTLLLEFMPDDKLETLAAEATALKEIIK